MQKILSISSLCLIIFLISNPVLSKGMPREEIVFKLPKTFYEAHKHEQENPYSYSIEYVPEGETADNWSEIITTSYLETPGPASYADVRKFHNAMLQYLGKLCKDFVAADYRYENNFLLAIKAASAQTYCGMNRKSGRGEYTHIKYFSGENGFHLIRRTKHYKPFTAEKIPEITLEIESAKWDKFFKKTHKKKI